MSEVDRLTGLVGYSGVKVPVAVCATTNITLSGEQTIDGVTTAASRILLTGQTNAINNGIWVTDSGAWERAQDCDGPYDLRQGSVVNAYGGTSNSGFWVCTTANTVDIDTDNLTFIRSSLTLASISAYWQAILALGTSTLAFAALSNEAIVLGGIITPTALAANTDNWAPTGFATASMVRVSASAAYNLTGIAGGAAGRLICLHNVGTFAITLMDDATSTAANRFQLSANYTLGADQSVLLEYDGTSSRWRIFGQQTATTLATTTPGLLENVGLTVAMAANAVTISVTDAALAAPSGASSVSFRNATITSGAASKVTLSGTYSTVISSGSTGGTVSAQPSRIWIGLLLTGGAAEPCWFNALSGTNVAPINEGGLISTTAEGGAGAADSAQTWYSTTARTNVPVSIVGYFDSTQTTAGTWAAAAGVVVVNPRYRPGDVVQVQRSQSGALATGTTVIPNDDTIPQITEGDQYFAQAITPTAAANVVRNTFSGWGANSAASNTFIAALFQDATANALAATITRNPGANQETMLGLSHSMVAGTTSSTTLRIRIGGSAAGTFTLNGNTGARTMGGVAASSLQVEEIVA